MTNNKKLLWGSELPEENLDKPLKGFKGYISGLSSEDHTLEGGFVKNWQISKLRPGFDTGKKSQKSTINLTNGSFESGKSSVKTWKERLEESKNQFTRSLKDKIIGYFSLPQGALMLGFVFGDDTLLGQRLSHQFKIIGMSHVTSASGYNISLLLSLVAPVVSRFCSRRRATVIFLGCIWLYIWLAGGSASLLRAGTMASIALIAARGWNIQSSPIRYLIFASGLLYLVNQEILSSLSFQLSASATLGLLMCMPWLDRVGDLASHLAGIPSESHEKRKSFALVSQVGKLLRESFLTTLAAQALTVPLLWYHFQEVSLLSLVSNTVLLWMTPISTLLGVAGVVLVLFSRVLPEIQPLIILLTWINEIWLEGFIQGVSWFGQFEAGLVKMPQAGWHIVWVWWVIALAFSWKLNQKQNLSQNRRLSELYEL